MTTTIGFLGAGAMGGAMLHGLADRQDIALRAYDVSREALDRLQAEADVTPDESPSALVAASDFVVLAVKPQQAQDVIGQAADAFSAQKCLVSICAGLTQDTLARWTGRICPVVRVMPNTPAMVGSGVFALCLDDPMLTETQSTTVREAFAHLGQVHVLPEKDFDAFTGLVGSGPAYVFYFMEALVEAGVTMGLPRPRATQMVTALVSGSAKLAEESEYSLTQLREMVSSPAGTTIMATNVLDQHAVRAAIVEAVQASAERSQELGKK